MQITGRKRLSHGLMFEGSYTFAKAEEIGMNHQDSYNLEASWALASYDINHRFVMSYLYEIPFGRNRRFASGASTVVNALIGGWQFNGITTLQAGTPLSITANNTAGHLRRADAAEQQRQRSPPERAGRGSARAATSTPPSTASRPRSRSATSRSSRRCSARTACATSICRCSRAFRVRHGVTAQFRIEALNAFNRVQFSAPNTSVTSSSFGVITGQANAPRQLQFGLKLLW